MTTPSVALPAPRTLGGVEFNAGELRVKGLAVAPEDAGTLASGLKGQGYTSTAQGDMLVITQEAAP